MENLPDISKEIGRAMLHYAEYVSRLYPDVGDYCIKQHAKEFLEAWLNLQKDKAMDVYSQLKSSVPFLEGQTTQSGH